jgi:hypothetical protein
MILGLVPCDLMRLVSASSPTRVLSQRVNQCCVSLIWMVMQEEYTGIYPSSGKRRPYVQLGGGSIVFPCTYVLAYGLQAVREGADPRSQIEEVRVQRRLLEMLIFYGGMVTGFFVVRRSPFFRRVPCLPFYRVKRRQGRRGCLRSEVLSTAVGAPPASLPL